RGGTHITVHSPLIVFEATIDIQHRPSPLVGPVLAQHCPVLFVRQAFTISIQCEIPRSGFLRGIFQGFSNTSFAQGVLPSASSGPTLHTIATNEVVSLLINIPETRHIDLVRTPAVV